MDKFLDSLVLQLHCKEISNKIFIKNLLDFYKVKNLHELKPVLAQDNNETFIILENLLLKSEEAVSNNDLQYEEAEEEEEIFEEDLDDKYNPDEHKLKNLALICNNLFYPPENFSNVIGNIYRASFPRTENIAFFKDQLKLKSILVMLSDDYPQDLLNMYSQNNITLFKCPIQGNKEPFINIQDETINKALKIILNPENHPILIHCNKGKHRTGTIVGCIRKLQNWSLTMIFDEYRRFAFPKARGLDQQCIEMFNADEIEEYATERSWLPLNWS
ncbi:hypothetical protein QEN19_000708 [Hanseniaspora menglaensis]